MKLHLDTCLRRALCALVGIAALTVAGLLTNARMHSAEAAHSLSVSYVHGVLRCTIPYHATEPGEGRLTVEVLDP